MEGAAGDSQFVYLRRTDGSPPMRLAEKGFPQELSPDDRWALIVPIWKDSEPEWQGLRLVTTGAGDVRTIPTPGLDVKGAHRVGEGVYNCAAGRQRVAWLGPTNRLTLYPLDGGEPREVPGIELEPDTGLPHLSEDEDSLIVSVLGASRTTPLRVERVDLATGRHTLLHELRPADMAGVWLVVHNLYLADGFR